MKKFLVLIVIAIVVALAIPVTNLVVGGPKNTPLTAQKTPDPLFAKAAPVFEKKCANCHTSDAKLPFYANLPIARQLMQKDIADGNAYLNMTEAFFPADNMPPSEVVLAKLEDVVLKDSMPPFRYLAIHWDSGLSDQDSNEILSWIKQVRVKNYATPELPLNIQEGVLQPIPQKVDLDPAKVAMGNRIFHDKRLSKDNTLACAGCHDLAKGGTDQEPVSTGVGGQKGGINAPTVYNSGYQFIQFWDGRAGDLAAQADGPVNNPIEMGSNWPDAIAKLDQDAELKQAFTEIYPGGFTKDNLIDAIATFEKSLITPNSRFDKFLLGDATALTPEEQEGYHLFKDFSCATCHAGKILGGQSFEKMGRKADYFAERGNINEADYGRFNATKKEADRYYFKVPTLRNIALTFPYLHDASTSDLHDVVRTMAKYQAGKSITAPQVESIVAFLKAQTGEYNGALLQ